jgi:hypothetical protein
MEGGDPGMDRVKGLITTGGFAAHGFKGVNLRQDSRIDKQGDLGIQRRFSLIYFMKVLCKFFGLYSTDHIFHSLFSVERFFDLI